MDLNKWAAVATIVGVSAIPLSGLFIWLQLRQQTLLAKAANTHALVELSSPFNLQLIQDRKMAELWVEGAHLYPTYDAIDQYRYKSLLIWWLLVHENIYLQKRSEMLDDTVYESWQHDLERFARNQLKDRWNELRPAFQKDFAQHVSGLVGEAAPASQP